MRPFRIWLLAAIAAGAIIGILAVTEALPSSEIMEVSLKTFGAIVILAASHFAWDMVRGRADAPDQTDKPVP